MRLNDRVHSLCLCKVAWASVLQAAIFKNVTAVKEWREARRAYLCGWHHVKKGLLLLVFAMASNRNPLSDDDDDDGNNNDDEATTRRRARDNEGDDLVDSDDDGNAPADRATRLARLNRRVRQRRQRQQQSQNNDQQTVTFAGEDDDYEPVADPVVQNDNDSEDDHDGVLPQEDEEEEDGEDLLENAERDYQRIAALDTYGTEGMDDRQFDQMAPDERRAAEAELAQRDRRSAGFYTMLDNVDEEEDEGERRARRGGFESAARVEGDDEEDDDEEDEDLDGTDQINLSAFDVPLREWIAQDRTRREIQRRFRTFLKHYQGPQHPDNDSRRGNGMYEQKIRNMCASNQSSLHISYMHLMEAQPIISLWLGDAPKDMFLVLNEAVTRHTLMLFPSYNAIKVEIHVRVADFPVVNSLRELRRSHLDSLVKVHGVVTRRSAVYPQLQLAYYNCVACGTTQGPFLVESEDAPPMPNSCINARCESATFRLHASRSQYRNVQRWNLQETPGSVPPGRVPRTKVVMVMDDLTDVARPGEEVEVTGIFAHAMDHSMTIKSGFPVFCTRIDAHHVAKRHDEDNSSNLTEAELKQIHDLAKDPRIGDRIVRSIAPSIYGQEFCKMALAMSLFGGVPKNVNDKHRIRGDVNVLLLGDPGTWMTSFLVYYAFSRVIVVLTQFSLVSFRLRQIPAPQVRRKDSSSRCLQYRQGRQCRWFDC